MKKIISDSHETLKDKFVFPDNPSGKFVPLMKIKQPDYIWYCANPYDNAPTLVKKTIQEMSDIISARSKRPFNWLEGMQIPESMSDDQLNVENDYTDWNDKVYIADTGEQGFALFARVPIPAKTRLGFYGGQLVTKQIDEENKSYQLYSLRSKANENNHSDYIATTFQTGGILTFCQSSPDYEVKNTHLSYASACLLMVSKQCGKFVPCEAYTSRLINAGEIITWPYGEHYWDIAPVDEYLLSTYGEPVIKVKDVERFHEYFSQLKINIAKVLSDTRNAKHLTINPKMNPQEAQKKDISMYLNMPANSGVFRAIIDALTELPPRYLTLFSDQERMVFAHCQDVYQEILNKSQLQDDDLKRCLNLLDKLRGPSSSEHAKRQGVLFGKRASGFFSCQQYELALQFYLDAIPWYSIWCKAQGIPAISYHNEIIHANVNIATYYLNAASCLQRLGRGNEAADIVSKICVLQKCVLPKRLIESKSLEDLERIRDGYMESRGHSHFKK